MQLSNKQASKTQHASSGQHQHFSYTIHDLQVSLPVSKTPTSTADKGYCTNILDCTVRDEAFHSTISASLVPKLNPWIELRKCQPLKALWQHTISSNSSSIIFSGRFSYRSRPSLACSLCVSQARAIGTVELIKKSSLCLNTMWC